MLLQELNSLDMRLLVHLFVAIVCLAALVVKHLSAAPTGGVVVGVIGRVLFERVCGNYVERPN